MAQITGGDGKSILKIREFLGLNENPDGDTRLKNGELSELRNFRMTRDKHLQVRPGTKTLLSLKPAWDAWKATHSTTVTSPVFSGAWEGMAGGGHHLLAAFGGVIFDIGFSSASAGVTTRAIGSCTQSDTHFFGFGDRVYLLNGHEYQSWDGGATTEFTEVSGYVPLTQTACTPAGKGTLLENVNRLNGYRRQRFSPDGSATVFQLAEKAIDKVVAVEGTAISYTADLAAGTVTFSSALTSGTNTVTITYQKGNGARKEVTSMRFSELFNGSTDTRVFLYGDGSNRTIYSGIDEQGTPSAEYFPDLYEVSVGESNTPITSLVRHYARLLAFKTGSTWSMQYGMVTLPTGAATAAFYATPVNRFFGNDAAGQVRLVENDPLTMDGDCVYQWKSTGNGISEDQRSAKRISDRVGTSLKGFDCAKTVTFNRKQEHEYWFLCGGTALIYNYANDCWYLYTAMAWRQMLEMDGTTLAFSEDGRMARLSRDYRNDDGREIDAYAATGSMDFGREWVLKYFPLLFISIQPERNARISVTAESNRRSDYPDKVISASFLSFSHTDFAHFSFGTNRKPQVRRVKLKVKKAAFYKLIFKSCSASATATVLETDIQLRYAGNVK